MCLVTQFVLKAQIEAVSSGPFCSGSFRDLGYPKPRRSGADGQSVDGFLAGFEILDTREDDLSSRKIF
jgi:hypothetical protein